MSDEYSEQVIDYLTSEMLHGPKPPDLTKRIQDAWRLEQEGNRAPTPTLEQDKASSLPLPTPTRTQNSVPVPPPIQTVAVDSAVRSQRVSQNIGQTSWFRAALAIAAGLILCFTGWTLFNSGNSSTVPNENIADASESQDVGSPDKLEPSSELLQETDPLRKQNSIAKANRPKKQLDLQDLPFDSDGNRANPSNALADSKEYAKKLGSKEIVAQVDSTFSEIWAQLGIQPAPRLQDSVLEAKLKVRLVGLPMAEVSKAVSAAGLQNAEDADAAKFSQFEEAGALVRSKQFADFWSKRIVANLLRRKPTSLGEEAELLLKLTAKKLQSGEQWNQYFSDLLAADLSDGAEGELNQAAGYMFKTLAGGGNHRLLGQLGSNLLNTNLSCSKCHDGGLGAVSVGSISQEEKWIGKQSNYWSMVALLNGVDSRRNPESGIRELSDRQSALFNEKDPKVFFDLLDGQLLSAEARLPDGSDWKSKDSPRAAFANWIANSRLMDKAVVNQTWKLLFGRHLVPQVRGVDLVALNERQRMLDLLASQFASHGHDVRQLVQWIASTEAFSRAGVQWNRQQWLDSQEEDLEGLQLAELAFASQTSLGVSNDAGSLDRSLASFRKWSGNTEGLGSANVMLAQPDLSKQNKKAVKELQLEMPSMSLIVHRDRPTVAERDFLKKLLDSPRLSWTDKVSHVQLLTPGVGNLGRTQQLATNLLDYHQGDREEALVTLLWCMKNLSAKID